MLVCVLTWSVRRVQGCIEGKAEWNGNDSDEMAITLDSKKSDTQKMPLPRRASTTAETGRALSAVVSVCEECPRNAGLPTCKAGTRHARRVEPQVCEEKEARCSHIPKDPPIDLS